MFSRMVQNKINKSKITIDNSYNNPTNQQSKRTQSVQPNTIRKTQSQNLPSQSVIAQNPPPPTKQKIRSNELELKTIIYNSKRYDKNDIMLRVKEDSSIQIQFSDELGKIKLQIKKGDFQKRFDIKKEQGSFSFNVKKATQKKQDPKNRSNSLINEKILKEQTIYLYPKNKQYLNQLKAAFEPPVEGEKKLPTEGKQSKQPEEAPPQEYDVIKFSMPSSSRLVETQKLRRTIKEMKEEDKNTVLLEVFKIKKEYEDGSGINKKLRCPIHSCQKQYRDIQQLKTHLKGKHPQLARHGIQLTDYDGTFEYSHKALDLALFLGKEYPTEMKKIIKKMKTKTQTQ